MSSPDLVYRDHLRRHLLELNPSSALDIGCGLGELVGWLREHGVEAEGVDPVVAAPYSGPESPLAEFLKVAHAEDLPFEDDAFDICVFEYSFHHTTHPQKAIEEATRVARRAVVALDPWYDVGVPSQRVAMRYDRWVKEMNRLEGAVHHNDIVPWLMLDYAPEAFRARSTLDRLLTMHPVDIDAAERDAARRLSGVPESGGFAAEIEAVLTDAARYGMTYAGAFLLSMQTA